MQAASPGFVPPLPMPLVCGPGFEIRSQTMASTPAQMDEEFGFHGKDWRRLPLK
jgi:hypothetical protein